MSPYRLLKINNLKRTHEIEQKIRDAQIISLNIIWNNQRNIVINFLKGNLKIQLILEGATEFDIVENEFDSYYIGNLKCVLDDENFIWLSLDPYDEQINEIEERDNFKIKFKSYKMEITEN